MKPDERSLLVAFAEARGGPYTGTRAEGTPWVTVRDLGAKLGIHPNRVCYIAEKWSDKDWYDYGVCADLGWLTEKGWEVAQQLMQEVSR